MSTIRAAVVLVIKVSEEPGVGFSRRRLDQRGGNGAVVYYAEEIC